MKLPVPGYTRLPKIIGDKNANPPVEGFLPMSKPSWYRGIQAGRYPKPAKIGPNMSAWSNSQLNELMERIDREGFAALIGGVK
jgi:predicted DNA-binding transcriptional regulator AlpA